MWQKIQLRHLSSLILRKGAVAPNARAQNEWVSEDFASLDMGTNVVVDEELVPDNT